MTAPPGGRRVNIAINMGAIERAVIERAPRESDLPRILGGLQWAALHFWKTRAQQELRSTSRDYVAALGFGEASPDKGVVTIELKSDNKIVDMIENGFAGGDMRQWMFSSPKTRTTKAGHKLLVIPFRHGTGGSSGRNTGTPMPASIEAAASKLLATLSRPATGEGTRGSTAWIKGPRGRLGMKSAGVAGPKKKTFGPMSQSHAQAADAREILGTKQKEWHKSSIYMGMIRKGQPTKAGVKTSGYSTFRTISSNPASDPRSWFHPGIKPRHLALETQKYINTMCDKIVSKAMSPKQKSGSK